MLGAYEPHLHGRESVYYKRYMIKRVEETSECVADSERANNRI